MSARADIDALAGDLEVSSERVRQAVAKLVKVMLADPSFAARFDELAAAGDWPAIEQLVGEHPATAALRHD